MDLAEVRDRATGDPRRGRARGRRQARRARARSCSACSRRARADRGLPRPREDADRALVRAGDGAPLLAHPVHARPDALRRDGLVDLRPAHAPSSTFLPGPIFTNLLLADEINRAPPKTQAALLEAMQERQVTTEGETRPLERAVPRARDAEPDRVRGHLSAARGAARPLPAADRRRLPEPRGRVELLARRLERGEDEVELGPVVDAATLIAMQRAVEQVHVAERDRRLHRRPRRPRRATSQRLAVGASPRGSLALLKLVAREGGARGRDFVVPEDVKAIAVPALAHRLTLRPELWVQRVRGEDVVAEALETVPTPPAEDVAPRRG